MPSDPTALAAALASRYRIQRELGAGGMATVYLADDLKHGRQVALKVLRPELAAALGPERFLREIATTANLRHPHILPLYDSGDAAGHLYYVMPFVEGESLADRLARERQLPLDDAVRIAREVADALSYAHQQGVVHRDIKPANILLEGGHAVVADFGIARALGEAGHDRLTQTGIAVGTPAYMSPEQAAGDPDTDGRSDLYSLGCVLYEMLAGQPPFTGPTAESVARQHLVAEPRPITQMRPAIPAGIAGVLQRALAKNPADRFNPAAQFAEALAAPGLGAPMGGRRWARHAALATGALVIAGAAAVIVARRNTAPPLPAIARTVQVTRQAGLEIDPALSPDGSMVAYAAGPIARTQLFVRQVTGGGAPVALTSDSTRQHRWPRWSPDGSRIAFQSDDGLYVVPALGGPARRLASIDSAARVLSTRSFSSLSGLSWSPDGMRIAFAYTYLGSGLNVVPVAGGPPAPISAPPEVHSPAWSPDGSWIAAISGNPVFAFGTVYFGNEGTSSLWLLPVSGGDPVRLTDGSHLEASPAWAPDGRALFWVSDRGGTRDVYRLRIGSGGAPIGEPERLTTGLGAHAIALSGDGARVAYAGFRTVSNVWSIEVPRDGPISIAEARPVTTGNQTIEDVDVTRDGRWLVFDADWSGNADLYRLSTGGGEPIPVVTDSVPEFAPAWSPDGRRIAFHAFRNGNRDIYTVNADGTGLVRRTSAPTQELDVTWAPDGAALAFEVIGREPQSFTILPLDGGPERALAATGDFAVWSPRGDLIAYHGLDGLRVVAPDGTGPRMLVPNGPDTEPFYAAWSRDGRTVYYLEQGPAGWAIRAVPAEGGASRLLVRFDDPARQHARYGFTTDDRRFWFTLGSHESDVGVLELTPR